MDYRCAQLGGDVAQSVERRTHSPQVAGSFPAVTTNPTLLFLAVFQATGKRTAAAIGCAEPVSRPADLRLAGCVLAEHSGQTSIGSRFPSFVQLFLCTGRSPEQKKAFYSRAAQPMEVMLWPTLFVAVGAFTTS